jgi:hypothetical protein
MKAKKLLSFIGIFIIFATALTSCTKSFCSVADKAQTMFASENYVSGATYADGEQMILLKKNYKKRQKEFINIIQLLLLTRKILNCIRVNMLVELLYSLVAVI